MGVLSFTFMCHHVAHKHFAVDSDFYERYSPEYFSAKRLILHLFLRPKYENSLAANPQRLMQQHICTAASVPSELEYATSWQQTRQRITTTPNSPVAQSVSLLCSRYTSGQPVTTLLMLLQNHSTARGYVTSLLCFIALVP